MFWTISKDILDQKALPISFFDGFLFFSCTIDHVVTIPVRCNVHNCQSEKSFFLIIFSLFAKIGLDLGCFYFKG